MIVFMYPGQGSQKSGMGKLWVDHPSWELVEEASEAADKDVAELLLDADDDELAKTYNSQLATFVLSMVILDAVTRLGIEAAGHVGHSLGEYSALTSAGVLNFSDAVALVSERGNAMQAAAEEREGTMAAVLGLDDDAVLIACNRTAADVWVANHNCAGQVVIAGAPEAINTAISIAKELGAKRSVVLTVGGAFHTPYMASARERLSKALACAEFRDPIGVVVANVDSMRHERGVDWPDLLLAQLTSPVRWRQTLSTLESVGFTTYVEIGPGKVLSGMVKRELPQRQKLAISTPEDLDGLLDILVPLSVPVPQSEIAQPQSQVEVSDFPTCEGEHFFAVERLVVSPASGIFNMGTSVKPGTNVSVGDLIGSVGDVEVRSAFSGELVGVLALDGERVTDCQPIAWLRLH
ncbi:MAG: ACP S-malonyltransferase [Acidimicrobiaceae bacterium]|nr:ACP S-malonyltransferase [Acidimicrobiaceae bacterium]